LLIYNLIATTVFKVEIETMAGDMDRFKELKGKPNVPVKIPWTATKDNTDKIDLIIAAKLTVEMLFNHTRIVALTRSSKCKLNSRLALTGAKVLGSGDLTGIQRSSPHEDLRAPPRVRPRRPVPPPSHQRGDNPGGTKYIALFG
jgi:hypothetical protein